MKVNRIGQIVKQEINLTEQEKGSGTTEEDKGLWDSTNKL